MVIVPELLKEVVIAIAVGGLIGLERENEPRRKYAGLRTLSLLAGIAPVSVFLSEKSGLIWPVVIYLVMAATFSVIISLIRYDIEEENIGFTTSIAIFMVASLGLLVGYNYYIEAAAITIITALLLAEKELLHNYVDKLSDNEISDAMKFGVLVFVLLPILPAQPVGPFSAINLREVVVLAILVLLIQFAAFVLMKQIGSSKGLRITGFLGGGASSFATTGVMAKIAKKKEKILNIASSAAMLSVLAMIIRNFAIFAAIDWNAVTYIVYPVAAMAILALVFSFLWRDGHEKENVEVPMNSPFSFQSAAKFAAVFIVISVVAAFAETFLGNTGLYITSFVGGLVSSTAVATSAAALLSDGALAAQSASGMIVLSIFGSIVSKILLVEAVNKDMRLYVSLPLLLTGIVGVIVFFV